MAGYYSVCACKDPECPGCEVSTEDRDLCLHCKVEPQEETGAYGLYCSRECMGAARMAYESKRKANLQRWGLRPKGVEIVVNKSEAA